MHSRFSLSSFLCALCDFVVNLSLICFLSFFAANTFADEPKDKKVADYFPPPESKGGGRSLLPARARPDADQKAKVPEMAGVDWEKQAHAAACTRTAGGPL